jgi:hypothetical protein
VGFLLDHLPLKLASLGLATLLWFVIAGEKTSERGLTVGVELQNFPKDLELTGELANTVEVRLRASPGVIHRLGPADVSARVDLGGAMEGERIVHLTTEDIRVPFGVRVVKITPAILTLNFERTLQKVVPIRGRIIGAPAPRYEVAEVVAQPAQVLVAGPRSRVQQLENAFTEPVSVEAARDAVQQDVSIGLDDPVLRILGSTRVRVTARVREVQEVREYAGLRVELRGLEGAVRPASVTVVLSGTASALRGTPAAHVRPYVQASALRGRVAAVAVEIAPGHAGVAVKETRPATVSVRPGGRK